MRALAPCRVARSIAWRTLPAAMHVALSGVALAAHAADTPSAPSSDSSAVAASAVPVWAGRTSVDVACETSRSTPARTAAELHVVGLDSDLWVVVSDVDDVVVFAGKDPLQRSADDDAGAWRLALGSPASPQERPVELHWRVDGCRHVFRATLRRAEPATPDAVRAAAVAASMRDVETAQALTRDGRIKAAIDVLQRTVERSAAAFGRMHRASVSARRELVDAMARDADYASAQRAALGLAADLAAAHGDDAPPRLAALARVARFDIDRGELDSAARRYDALLPQLRTAFGREHRLYCWAMFDAGYLYRQTAAFRRALAANQEAAACLAGSEGPSARSVLGVKTEQAFVLYKLGATGDALSLALETYRRQLEQFGPRDRAAIINLDNIAGYYLELGRIEEAVATQQRAQALYEEVYGVDHPYTLLPLGNLVNVLRTAGRHAEALPLAERAYRLHAKAYGESHPTTLFNRYWYAVALGRTGRWQAALAEHEAVLRARRAQFDRDDIHVLDSRRAVANARLTLGEPAAAQRELAAVCPVHERLEGRAHFATLECWRELGNALAALGRNAEAVEQLQRYVSAAEDQRSVQAATVESRQAFLSLHAPTYKRLAVMHARAGRAEEALRAAELVKGRTLLDTLITQRADELAPLAAIERAELREREERLAQLDERMTEARSDPSLRLALEAQRQEVVASLQSLRRELRARHPQYEQMDVARRVDARTAARHLPPDALFVSYVLAERDLLVVTVDAQARVRTRVLDATAVRSAVQAFRVLVGPDPADRVWQRRDGTFVLGLEAPEGAVAVESIGVPLRVLSAHLVAPVERMGGAGKAAWIVAADEALSVVPFELLPRGRGRLVDRVDLSYVQSLAVHVRLAERALEYRKSARPRDLLSVGAVDYGAAGSGVITSLATRGAAVEALPQNREAVPEWLRSRGAAWAPLPASAREVENVSALFARSLTLTGAAASEARLAAMNASGELAAIRLLHFATHGYVDTREPMRSAIVLAQLAEDGFDGYLTAREWLGYRLRSDLTVLSACETALGGEVAGEGVLGLPYALFVAGNRNTLLSLWKVPDASAAEFMTRFFAELKAGRSQATALARTKRAFMRDARWRDPLHWAGFVLYGS